MSNTRPFTVKGIGFTTPKGKALWCKNVEPERKFNDKGDLMTSLILDPNEAEVKDFIAKLESLRDQAYDETVESLGAVKGKQVVKRDIAQEDTDKDGNPTGNVVVKLKLSNVDDRKADGRPYTLTTYDAKKQKIEHPPTVGNGSTIRCSGFANPYYMASTKQVGVSLIWQGLQIIDLVELGGGDDFAVEDGYVGEEVPF